MKDHNGRRRRARREDGGDGSERGLRGWKARRCLFVIVHLPT